MTIGETLRAAREAKGFSVQDVITATRMTARQVTDMEADDFSSFAYPFYAKVFLRQFARAVGLDPAPLVARWTAESGSAGSSSGHAPIVPLETIDDENGGLRVVKPEVPSEPQKPSGDEDPAPRRPDHQEKRLAPLPEPPPKNDEPRPEKRAAAVDPAVAAAATMQDAVVAPPAVPRPASDALPLPVKRIAEVRPGEIAPEPVSLRAPAVAAAREIRPVRDLPPVVKKLPVDPEEEAVAVSPSAPATVPDFIETSVPAFVFPGAVPAPVPAPALAPTQAPAPAPTQAVPSVPSVPSVPVAPPPPPPPPPPEADLPLFSLQPESVPAPAAAVPSVSSVPVAPSPPPPPAPAAAVPSVSSVPVAPSPPPPPAPAAAVTSVPVAPPPPPSPAPAAAVPSVPVAPPPPSPDDSPFGDSPARRNPLAALPGLGAAVVSVFRRRKKADRGVDPFGGADLLSDVDAPSRRFPLPSRPVAIAGVAVVAVLAVAGLFFSGSGDSGPTPPPVDSDIEEEESLSPSPVLSPAPAQASVPAPTPAPTQAVPSVPSVPSVPVAPSPPAPPAPPAFPAPLLPPPRSFAR